MSIISVFSIVWIISTIVCLTFVTKTYSYDDQFSSTCSRQLVLVKSLMNESIDPCDNFYNYACGNWSNHHQFVKYKLKFDVLDLLTDKVNLFFKEVFIYNNSTFYPDDSVIKMMGERRVKELQSYLLSCQRETSESFDPYISALDVPGGWPVLNSSWADSNFDWLNITAFLQLVGTATLIDVNISPNYMNTSHNSIYIQPPDFPLFQPSVLMSEQGSLTKELLNETIVSIFTLLGASSLHDRDLTRSVLNFEMELASIYPINDGPINEIEIMTIENIQEVLPEIQLEKYLSIISGEMIDASQEVVIVGRSYFTRLVSLLNSTRNDVLANFLLYRFLLNTDISTVRTQEYCIYETMASMGFVIEYIYSLAYNNRRDSEDVTSIAQSIKDVFSGAIEAIDWLDNETIQAGSTKLSTLLFQIGVFSGCPECIHLQQDFPSLNFNPENYHENYFKLRANAIRRDFRKHNALNGKYVMHFNSGVNGAFYDMTGNLIYIPTHLIQAPVYNYYFPRSIKFGALGSIIGHELAHIIDDLASNESERNWWTEYSNLADCMKHQYSDYVYFAINSNLSAVEMNDSREDIADSLGLYLALKAYIKEEQAYNNDEIQCEIHSKLNITKSQLFFLSYAQLHCQNIDPTYKSIDLLTSEYRINEYRVIGTLGNFKEFSEEFNCPLGSTMNPYEKCSVF